MNLEQNKLETIENYYGSIKAYSLFLENLAFNFPNNNVQSFLKDKRITSVASFGLASNILLSIKEDIVENAGNLNYESKLLLNELESTVKLLFTEKNGLYYDKNHLMGDAATTVNKLRNKIAHGNYYLDFENEKITILDENDLVTIPLERLNYFIGVSLSKYIDRTSVSEYTESKVFTRHGTEGRKKPLTTVESIIKYMKNHEVIYITAKTLDNTPVPKNIREELDKMTNNFLETNSFKEIRKFIKQNEKEYQFDYGLKKVDNLDFEKIAVSLLEMSRPEVTYSDNQHIIGEIITKEIIGNKTKLAISSLNNICILSAMEKTKSTDINVIKKYLSNKNINFTLSYEELAVSLIAMFNSIFSYGLDKIYDNNEENVYTENDKLDYGLLDLSKIKVKNYKVDNKYLNNKNEYKTSLIKKVTEITSSIQKTTSQINNLAGKGKQEVINLLNQKLTTLNNNLTKYNSEIKEIDSYNAYYQNHPKYFLNKAIINGIRNSIAHGNYKVTEYDNYQTAKIIFKDIYEGQNTFEGEVYLLDFLELMHSNEKVIINYINQKNTSKTL